MIERQLSRWARRGQRGHLGADALLEVLVERQGEEPPRSPAAQHAADCGPCGDAISQLSSQYVQAGDQARDAVDDLIGLERLARQFDVIDRRLDGQPGRVLHFPAPPRALRTPPRARRWVAMAAASGLVFGLAAGRLLWPVDGAHARATWTSASARPAPSRPTLEPALADEHLLVEVDAALARTMHNDLLVLDELTPRSSDITNRPGRPRR